MSDYPFGIQPSDRILRLPPYLFGALNAKKHAMRQADIDVIDLGMGNPCDPTPEPVVEKLAESAREPRNHRYSVSKGIYNLRRDVAKKYKQKYGVELDPDEEVVACIGSKEGVSHLCLAMLGPGDTVVVGDPAYPIHIYAPALAGGNVIRVELGNDDAFLERIRTVCEHLYPKPKLMLLCYPHNPTAMTVEPEFYEKVVELARSSGVAVINDFAYADVCYGDYRAPSFLAADGAKDVGVEFTSMSKSYNMAGWRVGFCAGNKGMVKALATIKGYYDYGHFTPIQVASIIALRECDDHIRQQCDIYETRRDIVLEGLEKLGWTAEVPRAGMFVWAKVSDEHLAGRGTIDFCMQMMEEALVGIAPGRGFGENGEHYVRIALVENDKRLRQAFRNLHRVLVKGQSLVETAAAE